MARSEVEVVKELRYWTEGCERQKMRPTSVGLLADALFVIENLQARLRNATERNQEVGDGR